MKKILYWIGRHWILSLFLLIGSVSSGLNYSGFCIEQGRWLSDEEFLLAMLGYTEGDTIRNEERKKFLRENPECCRLYRGDTGMVSNIDWLNRITGSIYASGEVDSKLPDTEIWYGTNPPLDYYRRYITLDTCGKSYSKFSDKITKQDSELSYEIYLRKKQKGVAHDSL
ncbi:MAG: hypothetical protein R3D71_10055 [Rickettsiales bacterium]